jgi:hypothetical protein
MTYIKTINHMVEQTLFHTDVLKIRKTIRAMIYVVHGSGSTRKGN